MNQSQTNLPQRDNKRPFNRKKINFQRSNIYKRRFQKKNPASVIRVRSFGGRK